MARNSIYGNSHKDEIVKYSRAIIGNIGHITNEEIEILKFLAYKGSFEEEKIVKIDVKSKLNNLLKEKK